MRPWASAVRRHCMSRRRAPFPKRSAPGTYPADHHARRVDVKGYIKWRDRRALSDEALRGEIVALARRDDGDWTIRFRGFDLATLSDETHDIRRSGLAGPDKPDLPEADTGLAAVKDASRRASAVAFGHPGRRPRPVSMRHIRPGRGNGSSTEQGNGRARACTDGNKTGNVLPMCPVQSVTHVAG